MKKITLFAASVFAMLSSYNVGAQTFTLDKDTSKKAWAAAGVLVESHINANSTSTSSVTINWKVTNYTLGPKWTFDGFCDNNQCYPETEPDMTNGVKTFLTFPDKNIDFHSIFNGDNADNGTQSVISVLMTSGTTSTTATFIAYKGSTGIMTSAFKKEDVVSIFPNPAQNYIDVVYNANSDVKTIAIYNLIGKAVNVYKVTDKNSAHCEFNADMPSGIYVVRIADSKGNVIATRKITRQ